MSTYCKLQSTLSLDLFYISLVSLSFSPHLSSSPLELIPASPIINLLAFLAAGTATLAAATLGFLRHLAARLPLFRLLLRGRGRGLLLLLGGILLLLGRGK